jgi:hypothetical protein
MGKTRISPKNVLKTAEHRANALKYSKILPNSQILVVPAGVNAPLGET